ncbi:hypothetical protein [Erwinia sp. 9145]|uniref:hypothetical protein n=1 Tax=Erwinia sp. 9145 TaxID=1500895 RepID=UPI00068F7452|nr:hypothetical protein [Erwinia sp. 9145]
MSEFMGTPGPWKWFTSNSHIRLSSILSGKDGDVLYAYKDKTGFPHVSCNKEDMALIAAAPELLEACLRIQAQFRQAGVESKAGSLNPVEDNAAQVDAVICKALGQPQ